MSPVDDIVDLEMMMMTSRENSDDYYDDRNTNPSIVFGENWHFWVYALSVGAFALDCWNMLVLFYLLLSICWRCSEFRTVLPVRIRTLNSTSNMTMLTMLTTSVIIQRWWNLLEFGRYCIYIMLIADPCNANPDAKRLFDDLLSSYNKLVCHNYTHLVSFTCVINFRCGLLSMWLMQWLWSSS